MTQYQIIFVLELLTLFACGVLFGAAWRGRAVNLLPICRKCRFDLRGHETMPEKCPECLADLSRSGAVTNRRAPYWRRLTIALLVACLTAMVTLWLNARPRAIEIWWEKNRPFWLIQLRLPSGDKETWALARGRVETGALDADQQIELLEASVDLLTNDPNSPVASDASACIAQIWAAGVVPEELVRKHFEAVLPFFVTQSLPTLVVPSAPALQGGPIPIRFVSGAFRSRVRGPRVAVDSTVRVDRIAFVGENDERTTAVVRKVGSERTLEFPFQLHQPELEFVIQSPVDSGPVTIEITVTEQFSTTPERYVRVGPVPHPRRSVYHEVTTTQTLQVAVLREDQTLVVAKRDPEIIAAADELLDSVELWKRPTPGGNASIQPRFRRGEPFVVGLNASLEILIDGQWRELCTIARDSSRGFRFEPPVITMPFPDTDEVLARFRCTEQSLFDRGIREGEWFVGESSAVSVPVLLVP